MRPAELPAGLSMLWERSVDPSTALQERFGMPDLPAAGRWLRAVLEQHWGIRGKDPSRLVVSDRSAIAWLRTQDGAELVVKWSAHAGSFDRLDGVAALLGSLDRRGLPVAAPLPDSSGRRRVRAAGPTGPLSIAVLPRAPGTWLDPADLDAVREAGRVLARLHLALLDIGPLPWARPRPGGGLAERVRAAAADPSTAGPARARLRAQLEQAPPPPEDAQLVHGDFRAANILVTGGHVTAVLDFDEVHLAPAVVDLAQASTYLGTLFTDWGPTPIPAQEALREGYAAVRPLSDREQAWLPLLTAWMDAAAFPHAATDRG